MQDPTKQYPRPGFPEQTQPPPGLAREMEPQPDHGEQSYQGFGRLKGRKALITGADSGIGRAAAIAFAREGADIALNYLPSEKPDAQEVIALIETAGRKAVALAGDIRDEGFCSQLVSDSLGALGGFDLLVNVAGHQQARESIADITTEQFDETFKTNVYAIFWLCKAALPHMPAGAGIINTASIQSCSPSSTLLDYASTKAATVAFTKALTKQVAPGYPRQCRGARSGVDSASDERRPAAGEDSAFRGPSSPGPTRPASRAGTGLCFSRFAGIEPPHGRSLRRDRREPLAVGHPRRSRPTFRNEGPTAASLWRRVP